MGGKKVSDSKIEMAQVMLPEDANAAGNVHGGTIMKLIDNAGGVVAHRHSRRNVVTVSISQMSFLAPAYIGNVVFLKASVNYVGRTSMEVGIRVEAEDLTTGNRVHTGSAYLSYVALNKEGTPAVIPPLIVETETEKRRYEEGKKRHLSRASRH